VKECELRLIRSLKEKENECMGLEKRVEQLQSEFREATNKLDFLEKLNEDKAAEVHKLK
jgi:uncharacterized protein YlxW (UPF0749 family)